MLLLTWDSVFIAALWTLLPLMISGVFYWIYQHNKNLKQMSLEASPFLWCIVHKNKITQYHPDLESLLETTDFKTYTAFKGHWSGEVDQLFTNTAQTVKLQHSSSQKIFSVSSTPLKKNKSILWFQDISAFEDESLVSALSNEKKTQRIQKLESILDALPIFVWEVDADDQLLYTNKTYQDALNTASEIDELFDKKACKIESAKSRELERPQNALLYTIINDERVACRISHIPCGPSGQVLGVGINMTAEIKSEHLMKKTLDSYKAVLDKIALSIAMYGPDTRLEYYNRAYADMNDLEDSWLSTKPSLGEVLEALRKERKLPEVVDFQEYKRKRLNDFKDLVGPREELIHLPDERTLRVHSYPHPTGGIIFVFEDVTGHLQLERMNHALTSVQTTAFENLFEGVAVIGSDSRLKLFNQNFIELWGLDPTSLSTNTHINDLINAIQGLIHKEGDDWQAMRVRIHENLMDRIPKNGEIYRTDGSVLSFAYIPLPNGDHLLSYIDISDTKRMTQALEDKNAALESADKLKSEFIANMSYELRAPLNTLVGFSEILSQQYFGTLNAKQQEYVNGILVSSNKLLHMINDILDLASIEAGYLTLAPEHACVTELLNDIHKMTEKRAEQAGLKLHIHMMDLKSSHWHMDSRRIKQALFRIISNAIKFTPPGGEIHIRVAEQSKHLIFEVCDNGIGMSANEKKDIFKKFHKTEAGQDKDGPGLGLSLVKNLVELHKGKVKVSSKKDKGTTVTCLIPSLENYATEDSAAA